MKNEDQIQFMVDPFTGKVAVFIPAPIVVFEDVAEYQDFVDMMQGALEKFNKAIDDGHDEPDDVPIDKPILFRAHGTVPKVWDEAEKKGINIVDATCPLVSAIHEEVRKLAAENRRIIIIGDHGHDEVNGIMEQVQDPIVIANAEEAKILKKMKKAGVVSQSTQMIENVQDIINILMTKVFDLRFVNTICFPTRRNHEQIKSLAELSDIMIVIGSFTSANSKRLTELAKERNERTYQVTCANDLDSDWFQQSDTVGVSAGASTPDNIIESVTTTIKSFGKVKEEELIYE